MTPSRLARSGGGRELQLLCDEMLKGVGRWLRAAGYDVAIVDDGAHDRQLLARARAEGRVLLTCDRRLAQRSGDDGGSWFSALSIPTASPSSSADGSVSTGCMRLSRVACSTTRP